MSDFIPKMGGERMTLDGIPLREGEKEQYFENHSLSWWRQFTVPEHKKNGTEPFRPKELTEALFEDYENHFGYPHRMSAKDMDEDGIMRLCVAIVKNITDEIVDAKVCEFNDWHNLKGDEVSAKVMTEVRENAERALLKKSFSTFLFGADPDAVIREAYRVAEITVKEFYEEQEKKISAHIRKSGIAISHLVAELRKLNINDDEIPEWITHCTPQREKAIRKIIKEWKEENT